MVKMTTKKFTRIKMAASLAAVKWIRVKVMKRKKRRRKRMTRMRPPMKMKKMMDRSLAMSNTIRKIRGVTISNEIFVIQ